ncbi:MAG TPA: serine hydrolase domain-containing protein [Acidobacteriota bacterium]|nr:serine hydrolase domain-containing protein [Acidobacteriota bacterium]HRV07381.1 serine hydrolase domain-containing protein [Acidobacteriota bacterium]
MSIARLHTIVCFCLAGSMALSWLPAQELSPTDPESAGMSRGRLERIDRLMQQFVDQGNFPGMTVAVARHGRLVYHRSFGYADLDTQRPVDQSTIFRIYSMSKPITAVAALTLWEEGLYQLDDPVSKYLPELKGLKVYGETEASGTDSSRREMTIRDLFRHTSGLGYGWEEGPVDELYKKINLFDPTTTLAQAVAKLKDLPLYFAPGTAWHYGVSIDVLGRLIEVWSGLSLDEFFQKRLFDPLSMGDTGFFITDDQLPRLTSLYRLDEKTGKMETLPPAYSVDAYRKDKNRLLSGGGGLVSTTSDYLRFAQMLARGGELDGVRILGPRTVELMASDHLPEGVSMSWDKLRGHGYGLGVSVLLDPPASLSVGSPGDFGWDGAASTYVRIDPVEDLVVLLMTHRMPCDTEIQVKLKTLVYQALTDEPRGK